MPSLVLGPLPARTPTPNPTYVSSAIALLLIFPFGVLQALLASEYHVSNKGWCWTYLSQNN